MKISERQLDLAIEGLARLNRPIPFELDVGLPTIIDELLEWLDDDRQWSTGYADQWRSLLADVLRLRDRAGPRMQQQLGDAEPSWTELALLRASVGGRDPKTRPEPSVRRRLEIAGKRIRKELHRPDALVAAFGDLLAASQHMEAREKARRLKELSDAQGLDTTEVVKEIRGILEDDLVSIKRARGERLKSGDLGLSAGVEPIGRVKLAQDRLQERRQKADAVIWLEYTLAPMRSGHLRLGDAIQFYTAKWLDEALKAGRTEELPPEIRELPSTSDLLMLINIKGGDDEDQNRERQEIPEALVRIDLGEVEIDQALQLAKEAAELVVALAVLQGSDPVLWQPTGSYVRFLDGHEAGMSFHASPVPALSFDHRDALGSDSLPEFSEGLGMSLARHLPIRDSKLRRAARLALWLRRSRETWEPAQVVLIGRVLEQVAGWAGIRDRYRFEEEYLRLSWALRRIRLEISNCWRGVWAANLDHDPSLLPGAWDDIVADPEIDYVETAWGGYQFSLAGIINKTHFLMERLEPSSPPHERLAQLAGRTLNGKSTAAWIAELEEEFAVLKSRERRVRNALVHGGAVSDAIAKSVLPLVDWLAADALHGAIEGILSGTELVDYFIEFRVKRETCREQLLANESPSAALFWENDK
jgi:hypothetical protein